MSLSAAEHFIDDAISSHQTKTTNFGGDGDLNIVVENKLQVLKEVKELYSQKRWHQMKERLERTVANQSLFHTTDEGELLVKW